MGWKQFLLYFILLQAASINGDPDYLTEVPVKILDVRSVASRYPAANSEYRTNIENGQVNRILRLERKISITS